MSKHTKGPWNWDGDVTDYDHEQEAPWLVALDGHITILTGEIEATNKADVALITASPDMLEALEVISAYQWGDSKSINDQANTIEYMRAIADVAIAKSRE